MFWREYMRYFKYKIRHIFERILNFEFWMMTAGLESEGSAILLKFGDEGSVEGRVRR